MARFRGPLIARRQMLEEIDEPGLPLAVESAGEVPPSNE